MSNINVGLIEPNKLLLDNLSCNNRTFDNIKYILEQYIQLKEISSDPEKIGLCIAKNLNNPSDRIIQSYFCLEIDGYVYYTFYSLVETHKFTDEIRTTKNFVGEYISKSNEYVYGNIIILKINYITGKNENITVDEIIELFKQRIVHTAIIVSPENKITMHKYINNPLVNSSFTSNECPCDIKSFIGCDISMYFDPTPTNDKINSYGSIISKSFKINGDIIFILSRYYDGEIYFIDISKEVFNKIMVIVSNTSNYNCDINEDDTYFYKILEHKYSSITCKEICTNIPDDVLNAASANSMIHY